ncbi:hypothetical protein D3C80_1034240 [compost metagenome]
MGQFRSTDDDGKAAVLEKRNTVIDQRRQRVAHALRHDHEAHGRGVPVTECLGGLHLAGTDRAQAGAKVFAEIGSLTQAEADHRKDGFGIVVRQPVRQALRHQCENAKIPEHQLHKCRHITMVGHIGSNDRLTDAQWRHAQRKQKDGQRHRQRPRTDINDEGHLDAVQQHRDVFRVVEDCRKIEPVHRLVPSELAAGVCGLAVCRPPIT